MNPALDRLNKLPASEAESSLLACGGAARWARAMAARRPFQSEDELFATAESLWRELDRADWLEAFSRHPRIGEKKPAAPDAATPPAASGKWSAQEQSGVQGASSSVVTRLAEGNRAYQDRFGYIFIVCATGKTADEMLALLDQRLQNDPIAELPIAAEEQRKIMHLRLRKLLGMQP